MVASPIRKNKIKNIRLKKVVKLTPASAEILFAQSGIPLPSWKKDKRKKISYVVFRN